MPTEPRRLHLAASRFRRLPSLAPSTVVLVPRPAAVRRRESAVFFVAARTDACPVRDASVTEVRIDASVPAEDLADAVAECSRVLDGEGAIEIDVLLRSGTRGFSRRLFAWLFHLAPPPTPEAVARLLFDHGFDRIEQEVRGSFGRFHARRLPGRT